MQALVSQLESRRKHIQNISLEAKDGGKVTSDPCRLSLSLLFLCQPQCIDLRNCPGFKPFVVVTHLLGTNTIILLLFSVNVFVPKKKMCFTINRIFSLSCFIIELQFAFFALPPGFCSFFPFASKEAEMDAGCLATPGSF